jgi:hypothetical protein
MLYIVRLTSGDCIITLAADERSAHEAAKKLRQDESAEVATVRRLDSLGIQFSPTEDGSLEVAHWDEITLDDILASEYPRLNEAYHRANAEPFLTTSDAREGALRRLKTAHDRNTEIIREGLRLERERLNQQPAASQTNSTRSPEKTARAKSAR